MRKRLLSIAMALCIVFSLFPTVATAASDVITGQGYEYNTKTKTLTVKEKGGAQRFGGDYYLSYRDECIKAVIQSGVTELGYCEFYMFAALTTVEFPSTITKLDAGAFSQCISLTEITIPETVTDIGYRDTFFNCTALKKVTLPSNTTSITEAMFQGCTSLETITFNNSNSNNVTSIGNSAFNGCTNLKSFTIPANVTSIGANAFSGCSSLGSITIPSKVNTIGTYTFYSCTSLTSAIFQNSMTALPEYIFDSCGKLSSVTLPSNLQTIGKKAFYNCASLSSINIPNTVTTIHDWAFEGCSNLSSINFASPSALTTIKDYVFYNCTSLRFITIPSNVTNIGANAFNSCENLTVVMEPTIAPTLGFAAFVNGKIVKTYVPKNGTGYDVGWPYSYTNIIVGNVGITNLTLSSGELSHAFSFDQYNYTATVPNGTSSITFIPTDLRGETITINGASVASGQASNAITLTGDTTTVTIHATYGSTTETYTIEVTKTPAPVSTFTLNGYVTAPVKNITPSTTAIDSAQYTGTVSWKDDSGASVDKFLGGTAYTATVTLTPKKGYTFKGVSTNQFTYTNAAVTHAAGGDGDLVVSIKFPATAARALSSIAITTPPKTAYEYGETFSASGMIVKATYDDGTTDNNFTNYTIDKTGSLTPSDTMVTLTAAGTSIKATQPITVAARVLTSIVVTNQPNKMTYKYGETFSKDGMVVTANYKDGGTVNDFKDYTIDKTGPLTMSDTTVTITAGGTAIKTTLNITINRADGPAAPSLTFSFDGSNANKLIGSTSLMEYSLDGGLNWAACTNNITLDIIKISAEKDIKVRIKETETTNAGGIQTIDILPSPAAPSGITATDCTIIANNNGKLSGVSTAMEYKRSDASSWALVNGNEITGLNNGTYDVRIKATGHTLPSAAAQITINAYNPATVDKLILDDHVTAPTKNGTPSTTAIETDQYNGMVSWKDTTGAAVGSKFLGGSIYTATVTLTPKYGYTFSGVSANSFTYSNAAVTHTAGGDGDLVVSIAFPATASRELVSITIATQPLKKSYTAGETFDKTGMVITATYDDDTTESNFTDYTIDKTGALKSSDSSVTVTANSNTSIFSQQFIEVSKLDRPHAPTVTFSFDGENANKLMSATTSMEYSLNGESNWYECTENDMDLTGATITTKGIQVRMKETDTTKAGAIQTVSISKAEMPAATPSNAMVSGKGTITGVTDKMEYKLSAESTWTRGDGNLISLDPGTYEVRVKATGTVLASDSQVLTIAEFVKGTPTKLDLSYSLTGVFDGNAKPLSVMAVPDKNLGAITVYYNGETSAPINAGTYEITVDIAGNEAYNDVTALELGDYIIERANHTGEATASKMVRSNKAESNLRVALPTDLPEGASYDEAGTVGDTVALIASHSVTGTMLTFNTNSHAAASATITIPVTGAANYNDYEVVVTITAEDREMVAISGLTADSNLVYNGMPHLGYTGTVMVSDNKVSADDLVYTYTSTDGGTYNGTTAPTNAGSYRLVVSVAETHEEFAGEHDAIDFAIQRALAKVTVDNKAKIEGEFNPVFTFTTSGFVNGESITGVTFRLTGSTITPEGGTVSGGGNGNYDITYEVGTLTIRPAEEVLAETISAATTVQNDVIASDKTPGEVPNGQKFVTTELMTALNTAIADAQQQINSGDADPGDGPENPVLNAIMALNNALQAFIDGIQVGTMSTSSGGGSSKGNTPAPITKIESGENVTGTNLDNLVKEGKELTVEGKAGEKLVFDTEALKNIDEQTEDSVKVEIKDVSADYKDEHPDRLVVSLTIISGGKHITSFGNGTATVSLPYELKAGEKAEDVTVWCLAEDGTMNEVPCTYDPVTKKATFKVNHFSLYVVGTAGKTSWTNPFSDVQESSWFYAAVRFVSGKGLMQGMGENSFNPKGTTTRGMIVTILWRIENQPKAEKDIAFTDVKNGKYYHDAVAWASEKGIINGYSAERFAPEENIAREQLAVILHNYAAYKGQRSGSTADLSAFADFGKIHSWSKNAMSWAYAEGIMSGTGKNLLDPRGNAERCQVAAILQRFIENIEK